MTQHAKSAMQRWYVMPNRCVLISPLGTFAPGHEVPVQRLRREGYGEVVEKWMRCGLLLQEEHFKTYFPAEWNQLHAGEGEKVSETMSPEAKAMRLSATGMVDTVPVGGDAPEVNIYKED